MGVHMHSYGDLKAFRVILYAVAIGAVWMFRVVERKKEHPSYKIALKN